MYTNFNFDKRENHIVGYHFACENPTRVMCLVHGIGEYAKRYERMAGFLNEASIGVISMDLRGHGLSEGKRGHTAPRASVLKDIDALIEYAQEMYPDIPITLFGHSMGGNLVLDYLMQGGKNDVPSSYVVSAPWIELADAVPKSLHSVMKILTKIVPKFSINSGCDESKLGNLNYVRPYKSDEKIHDKITVQCALECYDTGMEIESGTHINNHRSDNTPLLLMHGDKDMICSVEATRNVAARFKDRHDFQYIEWQGYYHELHNGSPDYTGEEPIKKVIDFILSH